MTLRIFDTDAHVVETPDLWTDRISVKTWGHLVPHVKFHRPWDSDAWFVGDEPILKTWSACIRGSSAGGWDDTAPKTLAEVHPSCIDPVERLKGMDAHGIVAECLYPNIAVFANLVIADAVELSFEVVRAYNDWILEYWVAAAPDRFVPLAVVPFWDVGEAVKEIERCAELGFRGLISTGMPHLHGHAPLAHRQWDPMWAAAEAADLSISFHVGHGGASSLFPDAHREAEGASATSARGTVWAFLDNGKVITELAFSGVLARYPNLKFVTVESGIGWLPFVMEALDHQFNAQQVWRSVPDLTMLPSEYVRRQIYVNYWFERLEDQYIDAIGLDHILFETDFPHSTCLAGEEITKAIDRGLGHRSEAVHDRILFQNASALFKTPVLSV